MFYGVAEGHFIVNDFVNRLNGYTLKEFKGEMPKGCKYNVKTYDKNGGFITIYDNRYAIVKDKEYEILEYTIDLERFYSFIK